MTVSACILMSLACCMAGREAHPITNITWFDAM